MSEYSRSSFRQSRESNLPILRSFTALNFRPAIDPRFLNSSSLLCDLMGIGRSGLRLVAEGRSEVGS